MLYIPMQDLLNLKQKVLREFYLKQSVTYLQ